MIHLFLVYVHCAILEIALVRLSSSEFVLGGTSDLGRCPLCYMWNLFSVVVFHRSMVDLRRGVHLIFVCTSSENMSSFWVRVLHHRGLFYERPMINNIPFVMKYYTVIHSWPMGLWMLQVWTTTILPRMSDSNVLSKVSVGIAWWLKGQSVSCVGSITCNIMVIHTLLLLGV